MPHGIAIPPEVHQLQEALRSALQKSEMSYSQIEQALALPAGRLDAIFSGEAELGVAQLFGILRVARLDLWEILLPQLLPKMSGTAVDWLLRGESLRS